MEAEHQASGNGANVDYHSVDVQDSMERGHQASGNGANVDRSVDAQDSIERGHQASGNGANVDRSVDAQILQNLRLVIASLDGTIYGIPLSDNLTGTRHMEIPLSDNLPGTRHIDIRLRQAGGGAAPVVQTAAPPGQAPPAGSAAAAGQGSRLSITVAADPEPKNDDKDNVYLNNMRGWLMTVATLFVSMTFQAAIQPPDWWVRTVLGAKSSGSGDTAAAAPSPDAATHRNVRTLEESAQMSAYIVFNTFTFATSLTVVLVLLHVRKAPDAKRVMSNTTMLLSLSSLFVAFAFAFAIIPPNWRWMCLIFALMAIFFPLAIYLVGVRVALGHSARRRRALQRDGSPGVSGP